jgi:hypothetical protein
MHKHYIEEMADEVAKIGLNSRNYEILKITLEKYWEDKIADVWTIADVQERASDLEIEEISEENAKEILKLAFDSFDAELGLNWGVIDAAIEKHRQLNTNQIATSIHYENPTEPGAEDDWEVK